MSETNSEQGDQQTQSSGCSRGICVVAWDQQMRKVQCSVFTDHIKGSKKFPLVTVFCVCLCFSLVLTQEQQHQELVGVE